MLSGNPGNYTQKDPTVKLPLSIQAVMQYGIPKSVVANAITKHFAVSPEIQYNCLDTYFTRVWTAAEVLSRLGNSEGTGKIYDAISNANYIVIYKDIIRHTLRENPEMELFLSFRKAHPLYDLPAYVIVKQKGGAHAI